MIKCTNDILFLKVPNTYSLSKKVLLCVTHVTENLLLVNDLMSINTKDTKPFFVSKIFRSRRLPLTIAFHSGFTAQRQNPSPFTRGFRAEEHYNESKSQIFSALLCRVI